MTMNDQTAAEFEARRSTTPALSQWLSLTPEYLDGAEPRVALPPRPEKGYRFATVKFDVGGLDVRTFACDPLDVADALVRLAGRIRETVA